MTILYTLKAKPSIFYMLILVGQIKKSNLATNKKVMTPTFLLKLIKALIYLV